MRIRKGHRCLPLAPADSSLTLQQARWSPGEKGEAAMVAVVDMIGPQCEQRATADTSMERKDSLGYDLEKNRAPADDKFNEYSGLMIRDTDVVAPTVMKLADTPLKEERSPSTNHPPRCKTWTISGSTTSATGTRDQPSLLEQSLRHVCAGAGMSGISAHNAVAQIIQQGLPGLSEGGPGLIDQVTNSFQNSAKFVEGEEPGTYVLQDKFPETKSLIIEDSGVSDVKKTVPSNEIVEVAKQLQNLHSFSRGSGGAEWSEAQSDDRHTRKRKAVANIPEAEFDSEMEYDDDDDDDMEENENSSVRYRSRKVMHIDEDVSDFRCKRDDGKGWRCCWPAEAGYTMCTHHRRRAISQGKCRRKKGSRFYPDRPLPVERSPPVYVANSRVLDLDNIPAASSWSPFLDEELAHDEHRQFLKAKSMKSLLSKPQKKFSHIRRGGV